MKGLTIISGLGVLAMLAEVLKFKRWLNVIVLVGVLLAYMATLYDWSQLTNTDTLNFFDRVAIKFSGMIRFDGAALAFSSVIILTAFFWFIMASDYFSNESSQVDHYSLVLFTVTGGLMLTAFSNMTTLFLGIEILSIPLYVLASSRKSDVKSNEAGFKYLIMGSLASAFLLFGIALIYGATGSFDLLEIRAAASAAAMPVFFYAGIIMILVAMCFKVGAAPFHFWAPDVYEGSPTVITALMSTIVKTAAFAAFIRLFLTSFGGAIETWGWVLGAVIGLSLFISNVTAASQTNVKRMLAYSSISHAAFMLMAILANAPGLTSLKVILYYSLAYSIGSIGSFTVLYHVSRNGDESFDAFNGLAKRNPMMALGMLISLLSLAGIPVTAGFFAKYYVFTALIATPYKWLLVLAVLTSCVGVYYYFKVIIAMYFKKSQSEEPLPFDRSHALLLGITAVITLVLGLLPDMVVKML